MHIIIMTSFNCNDSFRYVLRVIIILNLTEREAIPTASRRWVILLKTGPKKVPLSR